MHGTGSDIRHDIVTRTIVSEVQRNVMKVHTIVSDIHHTIVQGQEGTGGEPLSVSDGRTLAVAECSLTVAQTQTRSVT